MKQENRIDLIISDIHADIDALNKITEIVFSEKFKKKYGKIQRIINLGDVLERGFYPKQVLEKLSRLKINHEIISVLGNHDQSFFDIQKYGKSSSGGSSTKSTSIHRELTPNDLKFFEPNILKKHEFVDKKNGLVCVHGGPIEPKTIMPKSLQDQWQTLGYQKFWQRLADDGLEDDCIEGDYGYGYEYKAITAFNAVKEKLKNFIILCGHQHVEAILREYDDTIEENDYEFKKEKILDFKMEKIEILIESKYNYLIRLGIAGPEGYNQEKHEYDIHFGIIQYNPKKVILFTVKI